MLKIKYWNSLWLSYLNPDCKKWFQTPNNLSSTTHTQQQARRVQTHDTTEITLEMLGRQNVSRYRTPFVPLRISVHYKFHKICDEHTDNYLCIHSTIGDMVLNIGQYAMYGLLCIGYRQMPLCNNTSIDILSSIATKAANFDFFSIHWTSCLVN